MDNATQTHSVEIFREAYEKRFGSEPFPRRFRLSVYLYLRERGCPARRSFVIAADYAPQVIFEDSFPELIESV